MRQIIFPLLLALLFCWTSSARGQENTETSSPIEIEADRMETSQEKNVILFSGKVRANQSSLIINADTMTVHYTEKETNRESPTTGPEEDLTHNIAKITAEGSVKIVQEEWVATGNSMDYDAGRRVVILAGDAKAWQNQNMVSGERIVLYLNEGRSVVEKGNADSERVKAFIYPGAQEPESQGQPPKER